jgi:hypothetical protein
VSGSDLLAVCHLTVMGLVVSILLSNGVVLVTKFPLLPKSSSVIGGECSNVIVWDCCCCCVVFVVIVGGDECFCYVG